MMFETIRIDKADNGVTRLVLNRAEKHNSLSEQMIEELSQAVAVLAEDVSTRVVVLAAEGKSFCAGGDLQWMKAQIEASRGQRIEGARKLAYMLRDLNSLPKPLIGRVHGQAYGGGLGLMSICDVVVAVEGQKFGLTEVKLGLIPATISPYVVARIGESNARQIFMSGELFDTERAKELGLVSRVVGEADLDAAIEEIVKPYLSAAPSAIAASKQLVRSLGVAIDDAVIDDTIIRLADTWETPATEEGIAAFFEKRKPDWAD